ncbi:Transmembrane protein [Candidatus Liberibacter solanacearum]
MSNKMMENDTSIDINSQAVHLHLKMHQDIIKRMALNSLFIKTCCISLLFLFLFLTTRVTLSGFTCLLLTMAFAIMDTMYLTQERGFRASYNNFVNKLHSNTLKKEELFVLTPEPVCFWHTAKSFSIYLFYVVPLCFYVFISYISPTYIARFFYYSW